MSLEVALQYAGRGWPVFPMTRSKKPFKGSRGFKDATCDPSKVRELWRGREWALVALATGWEGVVIGSDGRERPVGKILVADTDGPGGLEKLGEMATACGGRLPPTPKARTPRGGLHVLYNIPDGMTIRSFNAPRAVKGGDGLDIKARGGYVVLPEGDGSDGRQWLSQEPVATLTPAMVAWIAGYVGKREKVVASNGSLGGTLGGGLNGPLPAYVTADRNSRSSIGEVGTVSGAKTGVNTLSVAQRALASQAMAPWSVYEEARIRSALASLDVKIIKYDDFLRIGMALHELGWDRSDGTSIGFDLWDEFCARSEYYNQAGLEQKWTSFGNYEGLRVGLGTIFVWAKEAGWTGAVTVSDVGSSANGAEVLNGSGPTTRVRGEVNSYSNGTTIAFPAQLAGLDTKTGVNALSPAGTPIFVDVANGKARATCINTRAALRMLGLLCRYDTFHEKLIVGGKVIEQWAGELSDNAVHVLKGMIRAQFGFEPTKDLMYDAVIQECLAGAFHPIKDYLDSLEWDGTPRIDAWLSTYMGAIDAPLTRAIARLTLIAAVRRIETPGCKFDQITVLEGGEGIGKSTALKLLAGDENFSDQEILTLNDRAQQEQLQGVWLFEIGELVGIHKAEIDKVKMFASRTHDRARPAYGRVRVDRPRQCVLFGSTNDPEYLRSQTGNRRFWPVSVGRFDLEKLAYDRDQLWAEAADLEATGLSLGLEPRFWAEATRVQDTRMVHDPWKDILSGVEPSELYDSTDGSGQKERRIASRDIFDAYLKIGSEKLTDSTSKRLSHVMRRLGWNGPKVMKIGGKAQNGYFRLAKPITPPTAPTA